MILISKTFSKSLRKLRSVSIDSLIEQTQKHNSGLNNLIEIGEALGSPVMKGYLNSKKVRIVYLLRSKQGYYIPFYIVRKETKIGKNISRDTIPELLGDLEKVLLDIRDDNFERVEI